MPELRAKVGASELQKGGRKPLKTSCGNVLEKEERKKMDKLRRKIIVLFGGVALLLSGFCLAQGQIRVYNPQIYNRTRTTMSNRAAARAALRKARLRAAAKKRKKAFIKRHRSSR